MILILNAVVFVGRPLPWIWGVVIGGLIYNLSCGSTATTTLVRGDTLGCVICAATLSVASARVVDVWWVLFSDARENASGGLSLSYCLRSVTLISSWLSPRFSISLLIRRTILLT